MDWQNERYVRLYTRDTTTWKLLDWRARTVLLHLLRKVDRSGVLDVGNDGVDGLAAVLDLPLDIVEQGIAQLTSERRDVVRYSGSSYVIPNFLEAQEATSSGAQRQRELREKRRLSAVTESYGPVTKRDASVTKRDETVTSCNAVSRGVTPNLTVPNLTEPNQAKPSLEHTCRNSPPAKQAKRSKVDSEHYQAASRLWALQNRLRAEVIPRCHELRATDERLGRIVSLLERGNASEQELEGVLRFRASEVKRDASQGQWFDGVSNWRPENVDRVLGRIGTSSRTNGKQTALGAVLEMIEQRKESEAEEKKESNVIDLWGAK